MDYFVIVSTLILIALGFWQVRIMQQQQQGNPSTGEVARRNYKQYWPIAAMFVIMLFNWIPYYLNSTSDKAPTTTQWEKYRGSLEVIRDKTFTNQELELDGKDIENCTLVSTTLVYRGKRPFVFAHNKLDLNLHPIEIKIVNGPAMTGATIIAGLLNELCNEKAKQGTPCPALPVNVRGVDEQLTEH